MKRVILNVAGGAALIAASILCVFGIVGVITLLSSVASIFDSTDVEQETITVDSKKKEESGLSCYKLIFTNCSKTYKYFVNDKEVKEDFYNSVQEGSTYTCNKNKLSGDLYYCRPKVDKGEEE